jgi:hypothetical protein
MHKRLKAALVVLGYAFAFIWIFGVSLFYYIRVSFQIYGENQAAIDEFLRRVFGDGA